MIKKTDLKRNKVNMELESIDRIRSQVGHLNQMREILIRENVKENKGNCVMNEVIHGLGIQLWLEPNKF